jgi:hypothetical protein
MRTSLSVCMCASVSLCLCVYLGISLSVYLYIYIYNSVLLEKLIVTQLVTKLSSLNITQISFYHIQKSPPVIRLQTSISPMPILMLCVFKIQCNVLDGLFPWFCGHLSYLQPYDTHATYVILDFIILVISIEYRCVQLRGSLLCSFYPVSFYLNFF